MAADANHVVTKADLQDWDEGRHHGEMPPGAAVLLWTGCDEFWGPDLAKGKPTYLHCGRPYRAQLQPARLLEKAGRARCGG